MMEGDRVRLISVLITLLINVCLPQAAPDYFYFNHTVSSYPQKKSAVSNINSCPQKCHCSVEPDITAKMTSGKLQRRTSTINAVDCESMDGSSLQSLMLTIPENVQYLAPRHSTLTQLSDVCCFSNLIQLDVSFNELQTILTYVPFEKLEVLNLQNNNLRVLRKDEFSSFSRLEVLNLDNNQIMTIHPETFRLLQLKELYLGHNQLVYLDERTFRFTPLLQVLDIKANRLKKLHNRNLYFCRNLKSLDLSYNHLAVIDEEAFVAPLLQLAKVDMSFNNLSAIPTRALRQLPDLQTLFFDGNPVEILSANAVANLTSLKEFHLSKTTRLKMVLAGSFDHLPHLTHVFMEDNTRLVYISSHTFHNTSRLAQLHLAKNSLQYIPKTIVQKSTQIFLEGNPLNCACLSDIRAMVDVNKLGCTTFGSSCTATLIPQTNKSIIVAVGEPGNLFCISVPSRDGNALPVWTLPNGTTISAPNTEGRIKYTFEYLKFEFFLAPDRGRYSCRLPDQSSSLYVDVNVVTPAVHIFPLEVGSEYVVLRWNQSLSSPNHSPDFNFLLIYAPIYDQDHNNKLLANDNQTEYKMHYLGEDSLLWNTYSIYRLKHSTNYSFCLSFQFKNSTLYDFCTYVKTDKAYFGMGVTLNYSFIAILVITLGLVVAICTARCVHKRFHIWQEEKFRSRLAESLSGQSFLSSNAESLNSDTYENFQMLSARSFDSHDTMHSHSSALRSQAQKRTQYHNLHHTNSNNIHRDRSLHYRSHQQSIDMPSTSRGYNPAESDADLAL